MGPENIAPGAQFANPFAARCFLENFLWKGHPFCPHCLSKRVTLLESSKVTFHTYKCKYNKCGKPFTVTTKTLFNHVREVHIWLIGLKMLLDRPDMPARELARELDICREPARIMKKRLLLFIEQVKNAQDTGHQGAESGTGEATAATDQKADCDEPADTKLTNLPTSGAEQEGIPVQSAEKKRAKSSD